MPVRGLRGRFRSILAVVAALGVAGALLVVAFPSGAAPAHVATTQNPAAKHATFRPSVGLRTGHTVEYWVGAVTTNWNVVPTGNDPMTGLTFDPAKTTMNGTAVYRLFTANWGPMLPAGYQGLVGPILKARAGDKMLVHFKNFDTTKPHSMHFHGVHYDADPTARTSRASRVPERTSHRGDVHVQARAGGRLRRRMAVPRPLAVDEDSITGGLYGALSILGQE